MLGILLLYWVGKSHYSLADDFNKSKWGYAILAIFIYYATILTFSFCIGIYIALDDPYFEFDTTSELLLNLISIPFGVLAVYLLRLYLKNKWEREGPDSAEIENIGAAN